MHVQLVVCIGKPYPFDLRMYRPLWLCLDLLVFENLFGAKFFIPFIRVRLYVPYVW